MTTTFIPSVINRTNNRVMAEVGAVALGVVLISALAQVVIHLPWTPVPITGQTFGVALTALLWGRTRASAVMLSYLLVGSLGLPVFAGGQSGLMFGATCGYLAGMLAATLLVGELADRGLTRTWGRAFLAAAMGSVLVFGFGLLVLSFFIPRESLLVAGLLPFLPGDLIKNALASFIAVRAQRLS